MLVLLSLSFLFFWQSCIEELIPPLSGVPCESVTFSVPSIFLNAGSCVIFARQLSLVFYFKKYSKGFSNHIAIIYRDSHGNEHQKSPVRTRGYDVTSPREGSTVDWLGAHVFSPPPPRLWTILSKLPFIERERERRFELHPRVYKTAIWEPGTENSQDFYWYTVLYLNVFMCNILYYRFAVLAQFFFNFSSVSFITWKKIDVILFLLSPVAVFFLYVIAYLVMVE